MKQGKYSGGADCWNLERGRCRDEDRRSLPQVRIQ